MTQVLLVHGGLWDDMDANRFWKRSGVVDGLRGRGFTVIAPDRAPRAPSWKAESAHLQSWLPGEGATVVAGSNGCSAALRLALSEPDRVHRLLLAWPATPRDERDRLLGQGAPPDVADALLRGETVRGVTDEEIAAFRIPVAVLPSVPENPAHQRTTVDRLLQLLPAPQELPGCPEPPHPLFATHVEEFVNSVTRFVDDREEPGRLAVSSS
ncbi:alpha/beta fold hydrolase [Leifsonia poae]|uniref:Alpha/beta hydrolase n=1 Tax=Leifsonia poae TaxID=110933 RepID=A0A9W6H8F1_9MICO|nr:hypothetical protein [Leifsonia poae]GLJ75378.1 hypothetical protein GCM10017584_09520 [Leifsonia poae]